LVNVLAGITGSASGGLSIALNTMGETYMNLAHEFGISPELMHRVASMASGSLDSLPHNGAVITIMRFAVSRINSLITTCLWSQLFSTACANRGDYAGYLFWII
jgi:H+/gluconate symporter-like permease